MGVRSCAPRVAWLVPCPSTLALSGIAQLNTSLIVNDFTWLCRVHSRYCCHEEVL
jgi:hypothetical protein